MTRTAHPWRDASAIATSEKVSKPRVFGTLLLTEYETFFAKPVGTHIDIKAADLNRWRCAATFRKAWSHAKKRRNGMVRFWNLGPKC